VTAAPDRTPPWPGAVPYRRLCGSVLLLLAAGTAWVLAAAPLHARFPGLSTDCLLMRLARTPCPLCGLTSAVSALLRGHPRDALLYHPLVHVTLTLAALEAAYRAAIWLRLAPSRRLRRLSRLDALTHGALLALYLVYAAWFHLH
jgi:hypothetical protein